MKPAARKKLLERRRSSEIPELQVARDYLVSRGHARAEDCEPWELVLWPAEELFGSMAGALQRGLGVEIVSLLREHVFGSLDPEEIHAEMEAVTKARVRRLRLVDIAWACAAHQEALGYVDRWGLDRGRVRTLIAANGPKGGEVDWLSLGGRDHDVRKGRGRRARYALGVDIEIPPRPAPAEEGPLNCYDSKPFLLHLKEIVDHVSALQAFAGYQDPAPDPSAPWMVPPPGYRRRSDRWQLRRAQLLPSSVAP